jgi:protein farnesyltransferase/geranylgeranyltransferase type-1 subunit alpha
MQANEHSPRCLRLTEHIIGMNAAHYTVWLYRAANVFALQLPIPDEIAWLNRVALENLKNYQIWHHRHLLVENHYPTIASSPAAISAFAASERAFLRRILAADTKNYHVWSYRSYLTNKLGLFSDPDELADIERMVDDDVRNNSAWSHRFFLVFSDPAYATPGLAATEPDPAVPAAVVDREVGYAQEKIRLAPQSQSGWNYLRGVLVKGGRKLATVETFAAEFVSGLGEEGEEGGGEEEVQSTHALDLLAEIYAEKGEKEKADLSLRRLGQKWDRIRIGYWEWRRKCLETPA